jgi:hypothetical protein
MADEPRQYLIGHIRDALADLNELTIDVAVAGGRVFLTGEVATTERKERIGRELALRFPDCDIANELGVIPIGPPGEAEKLS